MRTKFVGGNWKMFTTSTSAVQLARGIVQGCAAISGVNVALFPPFPFLNRVAEVVRGSRVELGGQNLYPEKEGAYTGEVSPSMLLDVGCQWVILGHSERRHKLGEGDAFINRKVHAALSAGLKVILCIGETLEERQSGKTEAVLNSQLEGSLKAVAATDLTRLVIAYEPVWAIGTGHNATPDQAQETHRFIRGQISAHFGEEPASQLPIQYGGSVKPDNARTIMEQPDVDGALVGGASLQVDSFLAIVRAGEKKVVSSQ
jgi:triosephosphate isomerase